MLARQTNRGFGGSPDWLESPARELPLLFECEPIRRLANKHSDLVGHGGRATAAADNVNESHPPSL